MAPPAIKYGGPLPDKSPGTPSSRREKGIERLLIALGYLLFVNLPVAAGFLFFIYHGAAFVIPLVTVPSFLLLISAARILGGRYGLIATALSTIPAYPILVVFTGRFVPVGPAGATEDPFDMWMTAIFLLLAVVAVLSLVGAVFYEPLSRWVEHRRDR